MDMIPCTCKYNLLGLILQPTPQFLPDFKNPCWRERFDQPIDALYEDNGFAKYSPRIRNALQRIRSAWSGRGRGRHPADRLRCLPYFFLAGQPKCGSTDLYRKLMEHPHIAATPVKEPHWWAKNRHGETFDEEQSPSWPTVRVGHESFDKV